MKSLSRVQLFAISWTVAHQAPPPMGISRQEYRSGLAFPSPGDLPDPGIEPGSPTLLVDALQSEPPGKSGKVMSLLFNMLSRFVITFLPRNKCLLISWLLSPSAVILEPPKKNKVCHCFNCFLIYLPWSDGETIETVTDFIFLCSRIIADGDCSHEIKRCFLQAMTNLESVL